MNSCHYCHSPFEGTSNFCCSSCEMLATWQDNGQSPLVQKRIVQKRNVDSGIWSKFNVPELEAAYNFSKCPLYKKFKFYVEGLQCSSCVHLLEDLPLYAPGISKAHVDYTRHTLDIQVQPQLLLGDICGWVSSLGYKPSPVKEETDYQNAKQLENREDLKRIGVAGAVAGNLMLFSVPVYAGLQGALSVIFQWLSFFLFLPIIFYSAKPFFKKAWASLLVRRINVDMMIVIALVSGFSLSTYSLILGLDDIYFDSTASFIFLILLTRYILKKYQDNALQKNILEEMFGNEIYETLDGALPKLLKFNTLYSGLQVNVRAPQAVPCDSVLINSSAYFDFSFLTGEAFSQIKYAGDPIPAGSRLVEGSAWIKITEEPAKSGLAKSLAQLNFAGGKSQFQNMSDLMAHRLTLVVFSLAGLFFIMAYPTLGIEAFKRCLALITIACPCAIAFGAPLAHSLGLKRALQNGFYIRSGNVFEKLSTVSTVVFDKTGTLTSSDLNLVNTFPPNISEEYKSIILGLENSSVHPVAVSLRRAWPDSLPAPISSAVEVAGSGVCALVDSREFRLSRPKVTAENEVLQIDFTCDGKAIGYLYFTEKIVPEAASVIRELRKKDVDSMMLTGDSRYRAIEVAKKVGIRPAHVFSEQSPESKSDVIVKNNPCLYVGDGLNDLQALQQAHVSFAVRGPYEATMQVSDIYAPQKNLTALLDLFSLSERVQSTLKFNLFFAVLYNSIGGILALLGLVNPLVAAVLMPLSSLIITLHTAWRLS